MPCLLFTVSDRNDHPKRLTEIFLNYVYFGVALLATTFGLLQLRRLSDHRAAAAAWQRLLTAPSCLPDCFELSLSEGLPEPAQRYFNFMIAPGAQLSATTEITMGGALALGTKDKPNYQPMQARQILSPPHGFVWNLEAGRWPVRIAGSDGIEGGNSWVRFWLMGIVPVVRAGGGIDHLRAAFGRVVAEAAIWTPAALLPQNGVTWEVVDTNTARATVTHRGLTQTVDIRVNEEGRPMWVVIPRWTDANPEKTYRIQPFGGTLLDFREVEGYRLPFRVDGGNLFGTDAYFPFYRVEVQQIRPI